MTCSRHQRIIDDIGDLDRLPPESARHIDECHACAEFARNLVSLRALLREQGRVAAPADFDARLARRIREVRAPVATTGVLDWLVVPQRMLAGAAAFALMAAGVFVVANYRAESPANSHVQMASKQSTPSAAVVAEQPLQAPVAVPQEVANSTGAPLVNIASTQSRARNGARRSMAVGRFADRGDAVLLVQDSDGARVVNVPRILVGAERIVPIPDSESSIAALDDRMAF